jgi:hypothetical protein
MVLLVRLAGSADPRLEVIFSLGMVLCYIFVCLLEARPGTMPKKIEAKILKKFPKLKNANEITRIVLAIALMLIAVSMFLIFSFNVINACIQYIATLLGML